MREHPKVSELATEIGNTLAHGEQQRTVCPACGGGRSAEKSLLVYRRNLNEGGGVGYKCFRATCAAAGTSSSGPVPWERDADRRKKFTPSFFFGPTKSIDSRLGAALEHKYGVSAEWMRSRGVAATESPASLLLPLRDDRYAVFGMQRKFLEHADGPKVKSYFHRDCAKVSYHNDTKDSSMHTLVLVEDVLSSMRLEEAGVDAAALLGSTISDKVAYSIAMRGYFNTVLALDADTWTSGTPTKLLAKYRGVIPGLRLLKLDADIKDLHKREFYALVSQIIGVAS